jgi:SAM-dependent methyltransferase
MTLKNRSITETQKQQAEYYDNAYTIGRKSVDNTPMVIWFSVKESLKTFMKAGDFSISKCIKDIHSRWIHSCTRGRVLDLGCGHGSSFSHQLAKNNEAYIGIDLSEMAVIKYKNELDRKGIKNPDVRVMDFFDNDFSDDYFDIIYASAVLHHFRDTDRLYRELYRVVKPTGTIISSDPLSTYPISVAVRKVYRLFQTNQAWEWPFGKHTFILLERYFIVEAVQGFIGPVCLLGFLLSLIPGYKGNGEIVYRKGIRLDLEYASRIGPALWRRNIIAMKMRKRRHPINLGCKEPDY